MDINKAFTILLGFEGTAFTNIKQDAGGATKYGISHKAYPKLDIAGLTEDKAKAIYATDYWNAAGCPKLKPELQYIHFDTAVNMGAATAVKLMQQITGLQPDGIVGPETLAKSNTLFAAEYLLYRLAGYAAIVEKNPSQLIFIKGWTNRVIKLMQMSKAGELA